MEYTSFYLYILWKIIQINKSALFHIYKISNIKFPLETLK